MALHIIFSFLKDDHPQVSRLHGTGPLGGRPPPVGTLRASCHCREKAKEQRPRIGVGQEEIKQLVWERLGGVRVQPEQHLGLSGRIR